MIQNITKQKSCKQADDGAHLVNYEANEKFKRRSNEKFDQMLLTLSFHLIKRSEKPLPRAPFLPCDIFHMLQKSSKLNRKLKLCFPLWQPGVLKHVNMRI